MMIDRMIFQISSCMDCFSSVVSELDDWFLLGSRMHWTDWWSGIPGG